MYSTTSTSYLDLRGPTSKGRKREGGHGLRREGKEGEWEGERGMREERGSLGRGKGEEEGG